MFCFGFDWLGRQFATPLDRSDDEHATVLMFEPGTGEVLEIPAPFVTFHDEELVDHGDAALASEWFEAWHGAIGRDLDFHECAGYKVPLFLGGKDASENLEITDVSVYWHLSAQLLGSVGTVAEGTTITGVEINNNPGSGKQALDAARATQDRTGLFGRRRRR